MTTSDWRSLWRLEPGIAFLNHGSFGACPRAVLDYQLELRERMEAEPVRFLLGERVSLLDVSRRALARFVHCSPESLVFLPNATTGVNTVLRSLRFRPGDELLTTSHAYNACRNALDYAAAREGAAVSVVEIPFPVASADDVHDRIVSAVTSRTRLALLDHVTSATGTVFPIERIVEELERRGVATLVDGAHAPGMVEVDLERLGATYYTANCHKWMCAPKGAAFLFVAPRQQEPIRPLVISHGANAQLGERSRFHEEFDWQGTADFSPYLCVGAAIDCLGTLLPGGWPELRHANRRRVLDGLEILRETLPWSAACPEDMVGSLVTLAVPRADLYRAAAGKRGADWLHDELFTRHRVEVLVSEFPPGSGQVCVRFSGMLYNDDEEYHRLAAALTAVLGIG